jgi:hypothetical protein
MTEAEWAACTDPAPMMAYLAGRTSVRKLRLIGCGCCRAAWPVVDALGLQAAVVVAERLADGIATPSGLCLARRNASYTRDMATGSSPGEWGLLRTPTGIAVAWAVYDLIEEHDPPDDPGYVYHHVSDAVDRLADSDGARSANRRRQAEIIRCIAGNPFRPVALHPSWLTSTVTGLAETIYNDRAFDRLPILADALQDAGCEDADILNHCRGTAAHARGCWVVDAVLGGS